MENNLSEKEVQEMDKAIKRGIKVIGAIIALIIILANTIVFIKTGELGVVTKFGAVQDKVMTAGLNFKIPFIQSVKKINCKTQEMNTENDSASKDLQDIHMTVSINYAVNVEKAPDLYKSVGIDYKEVILTPILADTLKNATAEYTAEETITKRAELASKIYEKLNTRLMDQGISVINVNITNLNFSDAYNQAIEDKQVAQQRALTAQQELEITKVEAEKKIVEAQGTAEANRILNESLTQENLEKQKLENQSKAIEKWNGQLPGTTLSEGIPFLNIN